jgi:hypothetical protein
LKEKDGSTEVLVDMDIDENEAELFKNMWPDALGRLKAIAERP